MARQFSSPTCQQCKRGMFVDPRFRPYCSAECRQAAQDQDTIPILSWIDAYALDARRLQYAQERMRVAAALDPERHYRFDSQRGHYSSDFTGLELQRLCAQTVYRLTTRDYPEAQVMWSAGELEAHRWNDQYEPPAMDWDADAGCPF
jgi:hypothetical protein